MSSIVKLQVPGDLRFRYVVLASCSSACQMALAAKEIRPLAQAAAEPFVAEFLSAISEIFNNIVIHAQPAYVAVAIEIDGDRVVLRTEDDGRSFDPGSAPEPALETLPEHGMGLSIARQSVDTLDYTPGPPNCWVLAKKHQHR